MKRVMKLLIALMVCLTLSSCTWWEQKIPEPKPEVIVKTEFLYTECPKSVPPEYRALSKEGHIGGAYNLNTLLENVTLMKSHVESLDSTIKCYTDQAKKIEE